MKLSESVDHHNRKFIAHKTLHQAVRVSMATNKMHLLQISAK